MSQCSHSASALTNSSLGLERPIVASDLAGGVASRSASLLLLVPVLSARVATERMRLVAAFSLSLSSLRLSTHNEITRNKHQKGWERAEEHTRFLRNGQAFVVSQSMGRRAAIAFQHLPLSLT